MPGESRDPPWGQVPGAASPVQNDVSAVGAGRAYLRTGQKLGFVIVGGLLMLGAAILFHHEGNHHAQQSQVESTAVGTGSIGRGLEAPMQNAPPARHPTPAPLPAPVPNSPPLLTGMLPVHHESPAEKALNAPLMTYSTGNTVSAAAARPEASVAVNAAGQPASADPLAIRLSATMLGTAYASLLPHPNLTIPTGTLIPCTLQTAIDSGLPGFVTCVLPQAVRGATGAVTLLDRGTKVLGEVQGGLVRGEYRLFILWTEARTPQGVVINLASPAAGPVGRAGVSGAVDYHFWQRFGAALMFTILGGGLQAGANAVQNGTGNTFFQYFQPAAGQVANTALEAQINIPPTLKKNQGDSVSIFVARDLNFSDVYKLQTTAP
ncbi:MAG: type IV secretion system protein VirB10 [Acetobacteraceae bacterium]